MSWLMKVAAAVAMSFGLGSFADLVGVKADAVPDKPVAVEQLGTMLENSGFTVEPQKRDDGTITGYKIEIVSGEQTIPVYFQISDDKRSVTITAELMPLKDLDGVPASALAALLQQNNLASSPFIVGMNEHFVVTMQLSKLLDGLTASDLYDTIERLQETIDASADLWYLDFLIGADWNSDDPPQ